MFENLKQAQRSGPTARERLRLWVMGASLLLLAGAFVSVRQCETLPGSRDLPSPVDREALERETRRVDREWLAAQVPDDAAGQARFHEPALEHVRTLLAKGLGGRPVPIEASALAARPRDEALGGWYEVQGRITALTSTEHRNQLERLWAVVLQGADGGQVVAVRVAPASEPGQGAPADAWVVAPTELKVGDLAIARGVYVQRRVGTIGGIALGDPTPVLLAPTWRRVVEPEADVISSPKEASLERIDDQFQAGTVHLEDPAIYQILQWIRSKGHLWFRERIASGELTPLPWGRDEFDAWSAEVNLRTAAAPRPFTAGSRGRLFSTSGVVGLALLDDWESVRPNPWGVHQLHFLYLWSDFYGNTVLPCLSAFPYEAYGVGDWRAKDRVIVHGIFVKNHTYDTQRAREGGGAAKLTTPLFLVVDVRPYPLGAHQSSAPVVWLLTGVVAGLGLLFFLLLRRERRQEVEERHRRTQRAIARLNEAAAGPASPPAPPPPDPPPA